MNGGATVTGSSGPLWVPIFFLPAIALGAGAYFRDTLPDFCVRNAEAILLTVAGLVGVLMLTAAFLRTRRLEITDGVLRYASWLSRREVEAQALTDLTFETLVTEDDSSAYTMEYLTLWRGDAQALKLNLLYWDKEQLRDLVRRLVERVPALRVDRDVRRFAALPG